MKWLYGMIGLSGEGFDQTLGDSEGQGNLACYSPWGHKESDKADLETELHSTCSGTLPLCLKKLTDPLPEVGLLCNSAGKEPACQCRRPGFDSWVGKILWRRAWQPTLAFLPGEFHE